ncbi:MAG: UDP-N-acetyl glucosamine 2-epimerase, partial [Nanoarchaeota archaeon]|nr:UDP-N-acetyl glucosamine 2-epimerase [Nanoarchaeota archaeon]
PSTKKQLIKSGLIGKLLEVNNLKIVEPVGYGEMLSLIFDSKFVVTDSGGIQEEATYLGVPCLTMRTETERPITVEIGTNTVIGFNEEKLQDNLSQIINKQYKKGKIPPLWDGKTAERIIKVIKNGYNL